MEFYCRGTLFCLDFHDLEMERNEYNDTRYGNEANRFFFGRLRMDTLQDQSCSVFPDDEGNCI